MSARSDTVLRAVKTYLKAQLREIRKQRAGLEEADADAIHDVRVASRRLRALLLEQGKWFPARRVERALVRLGKIGHGLGRARELDVCLELMEELCGIGHASAVTDGGSPMPSSVLKRQASSLYVLRSLRDIRATETSAVQRTAKQITAAEFDQTFQCILGARIGQSPYGAHRPARRMSRRYDVVISAYEEWCADRTDDALHRLRIALKKLRYTCEIYRKCGQCDTEHVASETPTARSAMETFIDELKIAQDRLGEWHDMVVLRRYLAALVEDAPECERPGCDAVLARIDRSSTKRLAAFASYARRFFGKTRMVRTRELLRAR